MTQPCAKLEPARFFCASTGQPTRHATSGPVRQSHQGVANAVKTSLLGALLALGGCVGMRPEAVATESTWQALNVVDAGQTVTIGRERDRYFEKETPVLYGKYPVPGRTYAAMAMVGMAHFAITRLLDDKDPGNGAWHALSLAWQGVSLVSKGYTVGHNFSIGINPWGPRDEVKPLSMKAVQR
jgi:hypothetical protein